VVAPNTHKKSFIVGTYHHIGNSFVDSIPLIKTLLLQSELAIFESVDTGEEMAAEINKRKQNNTIEKLLVKEDFEKLNTLTKHWEVSPVKLEPMELILALRQEFQKTKCKTVTATDKWDHFDNYLIDLARSNGVMLLGLETDSLHLSFLNTLQQSYNNDELTEEISFWILKLANHEDNYEECAIIDEYRRFEFDYEFSLECDTDDILVKPRNKEWMEVLPNLLLKKNCFIAVGLLHLKYKCGLLEALKDKGFMVKPVDIKVTNK